jgi:hypothetical protein
LLGFFGDGPGPWRLANSRIDNQESDYAEDHEEKNFGERAIFLGRRFHAREEFSHMGRNGESDGSAAKWFASV